MVRHMVEQEMVGRVGRVTRRLLSEPGAAPGVSANGAGRELTVKEGEKV